MLNNSTKGKIRIDQSRTRLAQIVISRKIEGISYLIYSFGKWDNVNFARFLSENRIKPTDENIERVKQEILEGKYSIPFELEHNMEILKEYVYYE